MPRPPRYCPMCARELSVAAHGGRERACCPDKDCGWVHWDNPLPVVAALVEHPDGIVLVQNKGWPASWYGLVTGFLERDESPEEGVVREVEEELGLASEIVDWLGVYPFTQMNQVILAWHLRAEGPIVLGDELAGHKLVPPDKLRPWPMGTGAAVTEWLRRRELNARTG